MIFPRSTAGGGRTAPTPDPKTFSLTAWLDQPISTFFAEKSGVPASDHSIIVGGEGIGAGVELIFDLALSKLASKGANAISGAIAELLAMFVPKDMMSLRLRRELDQIGAHLISRLVDPTPAEMAEMINNTKKIIQGVQTGRSELVFQGLFRQPAEFEAVARAAGLTVGDARTALEELQRRMKPGDAGPGGNNTPPPPPTRRWNVSMGG